MYKSNLINAFPTELTAADGTIVRLCPLERTKGKAIYCSRDAQFYSFTRNGLCPIKPNRYAIDTAYRSGGRKNYLSIRQAGGETCHTLMALTWIGPKLGRGYEVHHLNGIATDNRASNLIWLSHSEHRCFDRALREGLILTRHDPADIMEHELTHHMEF